MLKRLGIFGCGNVGSALAMGLAAQDIANEVVMASRNILHAEAAILDAGSAYPQTAAKFEAADHLEGAFDAVVVTAGLYPHSDVSQQDLLDKNLEIVITALQQANCQKLVVIGTPVDRLTEELSKLQPFRGKQVIGFGGQLDVDRTIYALIKRSVPFDGQVYVIGEHGPRTIPIYKGESTYAAVRGDVTSTLKRISASGYTRNMATGVQLARLLRALAGEEQVLCVSAPDNDFGGLSITWPYVINQSGLIEKAKISYIGPRASRLLSELAETRQKESAGKH